MAKSSGKKSGIQLFKQELIALVIGALALLTALALCTYHAHDSSWFYFTNQPNPVRNAGGPVGAHLAALLFYLLGSSSLLLVPLLLFYAYLVVFHVPVRQEWERLTAGVVGMVVCATLCNLYAIDFWGATSPGGLLGRSMHVHLVAFFGPLGAVIFLHTLLLVCCILLARFSFMRCMQLIVVAVRIVLSKRVLEPVGRWLYVATRALLAPLQSAYGFVRRLCTNTLIADADYSVVDFEQVLLEMSGEVVHADKAWDLPSAYAGTRVTVHGTGHAREGASNQTMQQSSTLDPLGSSFLAHARKNVASVNVGSGRVDDLFGNSHTKEAGGLTGRGTDNGDLLSKNSVHATGTQGVGGVSATPTPSEQHKNVQARSAQSLGVDGGQAVKKLYQVPPATLFATPTKDTADSRLTKELEASAKILETKLERFGVVGHVTSIKRGPVVTIFEYQPTIDTKVSKILALEDDLALALQAMSIRIMAPIPGRSVVGFEVSNKLRKDVLFGRVIRSPEYTDFKGALPLVLGEDTVGNNVVVDLVRMPHLLVAGSTGSGKSVALNAMLVSLLCACKPDALKLILIDPKRLEFSAYADIPHLLFPIITDAKRATMALRWVVKQMEERYATMAACGARNIFDYHSMVGVHAQATDPMPFMVVVIDELADLMMTASRDIEDLIARIAQMARAAGIHMLVATQRPSVDVITGLIKVNFPSRISFRVTSKIDSRTILDCGGADKLLGRGDMLFLDAGGSVLRRVHGAYVSDKEIAQVVAHARAQQPPEYLDLTAEIMRTSGAASEDEEDQLYHEIVSFVKENDEVSISLLQRKFRIGFNRSARVIEQLEAQGLIMSADGGKTRKVVR